MAFWNRSETTGHIGFMARRHLRFGLVDSIVNSRLGSQRQSWQGLSERYRHRHGDGWQRPVWGRWRRYKSVYTARPSRSDVRCSTRSCRPLCRSLLSRRARARRHRPGAPPCRASVAKKCHDVACPFAAKVRGGRSGSWPGDSPNFLCFCVYSDYRHSIRRCRRVEPIAASCRTAFSSDERLALGTPQAGC